MTTDSSNTALDGAGLVGGGGEAVPRRDVIRTSDAPPAVGPYSQAIRSGGLVFTAGQIGLEPATGRLVAGGIASETRQALANLQAILNAAGSGLPLVVKTTVYLTSLADFQAMNDVYSEHFSTDPPARATVAVAELPLGGRVEIEAIARTAS